MAQVPYLTNITLYKNIPLLPNYLDTVYFASAQEQQAWFASYATYSFSFTNQMYQRVTRNSVRLEGNPRQYDGINYMKFQNTFTGGVNRWWYAFVLDTEYVNENVFDVIYEIDVMQTFMFDYDLLQCYVERQHSETDNVGDNLLQEPISIGDYVINEVGGVKQFDPANTNLDSLAYVVAIMPLLDIGDKGSITITSQPSNQIVNVGSTSAEFSVTATGVDLTFTWRARLPVPTPVGGGVENYDWTPFVPDGTRWSESHSSSGDSYTSTIRLNGGGGAAISDNVTYFDCQITDAYGYVAYSVTVALMVNP